MANDGVRRAIILHGPPGGGKSTIAGMLMQLQTPGTARFVNLDAGWGTGDVRFTWPHRYADLLVSPEQTLVVELGCGEPLDLSIPGATRGAAEWIGLLRQAGRTIHGFVLYADWKDTITRLEGRHREHPQVLAAIWAQLGAYALFIQGHPTMNFPQIPDFTEHRILTSGRTDQAVLDEIVQMTGLSN